MDKVIIVGAPRSGTNMLRDVLTSVPGFATWPCDEINPLWRHGNRDFPSDELRSEHARPEVRSYLATRFQRIAKRYKASTVVEKTCATSLRVAFADAVFPDARFVFIHRDGIDVAASTMKRWNAPFELRYTLRKARYVPASDLAHQVIQFATGQLRRDSDTFDTRRPTQVSRWWGPKPSDYRQLMETHTLPELAIMQWKRCVEASLHDLAAVPAHRRHVIAYEDFVKDPAKELATLLNFLGHKASSPPHSIAQISNRSVGRGRAELDQESVEKMLALAGGTIHRLGYAPS